MNERERERERERENKRKRERTRIFHCKEKKGAFATLIESFYSCYLSNIKQGQRMLESVKWNTSKD